MEEKIETICTEEHAKAKAIENFHNMFLEHIQMIKQTKKVENPETKISLSEIIERLRKAHEAQE